MSKGTFQLKIIFYKKSMGFLEFIALNLLNLKAISQLIFHVFLLFINLFTFLCMNFLLNFVNDVYFSLKNLYFCHKYVFLNSLIKSLGF